MLGHGFAGSEAAGDCRCASLCNGHDGVNDPLTCDQRSVAFQPLCDGAGVSDGPFLAKGQGMNLAVFIGQFNDFVIYFMISAFGHEGNGAGKQGRNHDFMHDGCGFGTLGIDLTAGERVTHLGGDGNIPVFFNTQCINHTAPFDERARCLFNIT